jgi:hypothetical protein
MMIEWSKVLPVLMSIGIIITIAILREYSRTLAAIVSTMPINIPLGMWIVFSGSTQTEFEYFTRSLFLNMWPTMVFILLAWLAVRAGWQLLPSIGVGYLGWGVTLGLLFLVRGRLGI